MHVIPFLLVWLSLVKNGAADEEFSGLFAVFSKRWIEDFCRSIAARVAVPASAGHEPRRSLYFVVFDQPKGGRVPALHMWCYTPLMSSAVSCPETVQHTTAGHARRLVLRSTVVKMQTDGHRVRN
jgi:hypothetical protein